MADDVLLDAAPDAIRLTPVLASDDAGALPPFATALGFTGAAGTVCPLPGPDGTVAEVLAGLGDGSDRWAFAALADALRPGTYALNGDLGGDLDADAATAAATAWLLSAYAFGRYRTAKPPAERPRLVWPANARRAEALSVARATALVRDLVNTPAADMGPAELADAARAVAEDLGASLDVIVGDELLARRYPAIHAVGRAAAPHRAPRLIDLRWGDHTAPRVTIVGKGVCFDSGGLDIKPASAMKLMKKDMGGAAHALGLARLIMEAGLPVRLRVLIPAVENAISADSIRPGDVLETRKGLTIEVNNTDAEGRIILADALAEADAEEPAVLIDFATLTGAARVALGPDLPALFANDDALADALLAQSRRHDDPLWRLPLWPGYRAQVDGTVGDVDNAPEGGMAGAITAALFLERFVSPATPWAHIDCYAWATKARPGRPAGAAAQGLRAVFAMLRERFA
ncbi:leucyl aminopeptidase family protein [Novispirillum sp. DQ9]|uniref:leucyl aminopeptidase family protein n=1 Tax=Novispirillum sp. DQ9 TaxID=3398612 RepID=UPI003C7D97DF